MPQNEVDTTQGDVSEHTTALPSRTKLAYNRKEAAALLGIHPNTLDRLVERGLIKPSRALRTPLFSHMELLRFLEETR